MSNAQTNESFPILTEQCGCFTMETDDGRPGFLTGCLRNKGVCMKYVVESPRVDSLIGKSAEPCSHMARCYEAFLDLGAPTSGNGQRFFIECK